LRLAPVPKATADSFASAKQTWTDASAASASGKIPDAVAKGSEAKTELTDLQSKLGIKPKATLPEPTS
jgi:phage terminase small subunit